MRRQASDKRYKKKVKKKKNGKERQTAARVSRSAGELGVGLIRLPVCPKNPIPITSYRKVRTQNHSSTAALSASSA
jgi:hypothetical protein